MLVFEERGKTDGHGEKTLGAGTRANAVLNSPTYDAESGNRTRATLMGSKFSHHYAIPAPLGFISDYVVEKVACFFLKKSQNFVMKETKSTRILCDTQLHHSTK